MTDSKNTILAIVLSAVVLIGWQYFFGLPQLKKQQEIAQQQQQAQQAAPPQQQQQQQQAPVSPRTGAGAPNAPQATSPASPAQPMSRAAALAQSPRVPIATPSISGSIALKGGRIDDVSLNKYRETVDPKSPAIVLLSPSGTGDPFYAEFGWVGDGKVKVPDASTLWTQAGSGALSVNHPIVLTWDNGEGLTFTRTIAIDDKYLFTIRDSVANKGAAPVTLHPYALVSRHGTPPTLGYYILHEGLIGVLGDQGLQEITYKKIEDKKKLTFDVTNGWLGITDKYWAAALIPDTSAHLRAEFTAGQIGQTPTYQTDYLLDARTVAPGSTTTADARLFAGAKEVAQVNAYEKELKLNHFDLLIDWGWFYFITKPMFFVIDWFYHLVGNFGIAILIVTVLIKAAFFPLANGAKRSQAGQAAAGLSPRTIFLDSVTLAG